MNEEIHALLARIDERTENTQHRVRNIEMKFDNYATRRDLEHVSDRVAAVEEQSTWNYRAGISFALTVTGGLVVAYLKYGH